MNRKLIAFFTAMMLISSISAFAQGASTGGGGDLTRTEICVQEQAGITGKSNLYINAALINVCNFTDCEAAEILKMENYERLTNDQLGMALKNCIL